MNKEFNFTLTHKTARALNVLLQGVSKVTLLGMGLDDSDISVLRELIPFLPSFAGIFNPDCAARLGSLNVDGTSNLLCPCCQVVFPFAFSAGEMSRFSSGDAVKVHCPLCNQGLELETREDK